LKNAGLPERKIYIHKGKNPSYYIKVTGTQVPKLYHYLYDNVPESQYLGRKYKLFKSSLNAGNRHDPISVSNYLINP
jgi:hypothetical protein